MGGDQRLRFFYGALPGALLVDLAVHGRGGRQRFDPVYVEWFALAITRRLPLNTLEPPVKPTSQKQTLIIRSYWWKGRIRFPSHWVLGASLK